MFEVIFMVIAIVDGITIGNLVAVIIQMMFGEKTAARLLKSLCGTAAGIGYFIFCAWVMFVSDMELLTGAISVFAPLLLLFVLNAIKKK